MKSGNPRGNWQNRIVSEQVSSRLNPRQKRFADFYLGGMAAGPAYVKAGYSKNGADQAAHNLLRNTEVAAYLKVCQRELSEASRWEKWQLLDFHQKVLETPVGKVDENHVLAQEVTIDEIGEQTIRKKVKMVGKMDSARELAKMLGWHAPDKVMVSADDAWREALAAIGAKQGPLPSDRMEE